MKQKNELMKLAEELRDHAENPKKIRDLTEELARIAESGLQHMYVETPLGTLHAYESSDGNYPGIYIDMERNGDPVEAPLILLEYSCTELLESGETLKPSIILRSWDDVCNDDYSTRVIFNGLDRYFDEKEER